MKETVLKKGRLSVFCLVLFYLLPTDFRSSVIMSDVHVLIMPYVKEGSKLHPIRQGQLGCTLLVSLFFSPT